MKKQVIKTVSGLGRKLRFQRIKLQSICSFFFWGVVLGFAIGALPIGFVMNLLRMAAVQRDDAGNLALAATLIGWGLMAVGGIILGWSILKWFIRFVATTASDAVNRKPK